MIDALGTIAGLALIVLVLTEIVLRAAAPTAVAKDRYGPYVALIVGVAASVGASLFWHTDIPTAVLLGGIAGWTASGLYDTIRAAIL